MQATSQGLPADHPRVKQQVDDNIPQRIKELKFGILSHSDIIRQGVLEVCDRSLYDLDKGRAARENGPVDTRMGISSKTGTCATCGQNLQDCNGHFGYVKLALPAFHVGYFKMILTILQQICKDCSEILLVDADRRRFLRALRRPGIDNLAKTQICKKVLEQCKKAKTCYHCGATNGIIKKVGQPPLKIIHDKFRAFNTSSAKKKEPPRSKVDFDASFLESKKSNTEIDRHVKKAMDDLNPLKVLRLFKRISPDTCELLGMQPGEGRPEMFIWQYVPAPPVCIRPSVTQDGASTEDDITSKLGDIVHISTLISTGLKKGAPISQLVEQWDFLQLQIALYVNADSPGLTQLSSGKPIRGFCQRLKGKQGRFRGNLSGKRVNFSGRTVISPDPNLQIDQVAVPILVAKNMTYPEKVFAANIDRLRRAVENGPTKYPGANYVLKGDKKFSLKHGKPAHNAKRLQVGDVVERHLIDDDIVLFNRQPSLHKLSILCHRVKVKPHRTFRLNECVCNPYNADFDGDEMNLHVPQTEEARTEAAELMGVKYNLATPKNGEPIIAAIQDFITGSYLLSRKDVFYDRKTFMQICMGMVDGKTHVDLPPPSVIKPVALWTGKQVFNVLMRPNKQSNILVNLDGACKSYKVADDAGFHRDLNPNDAWLTIRNSEVMCGMMDKSTVGSGKKDSLFYVILRDFGPDAAVETMSRLAKLSARWLTEQGFSIGIGDVTPGLHLREEKQKLIKKAYADCDEVIAQFNAGVIKKAPGCDEEQTMETKVSGILSKVRSTAGDVCLQELSRRNSALVMANSGSKGSFINVSQMVASVGQQIIGDGRVIDGFQDRSLPHFPKMARQPESKGFVQNSFFSGLNPSEFIFHAMSGREGLVDTAVKTAETGYMSRRLIKSLEDLSTRYDDTVRNSSSQIVQFQFGDDKLDPVDMEGNAKPVNFERTFLHSESITWDNEERGLLPDEVLELKEQLLEPERKKFPRASLAGQAIEYDSKKIALQDVDGSESARDFIESISRYVEDRVDHQVVVRKTLGLTSAKTAARRTKAAKEQQVATKAYEQVAKISETALRMFINNCLLKYRKAQVEPGHAVGAVGAQSIGEPGTQMTLKTFHFAGVAGMSITGGVPRIKEIINASKTISTPVISCPLIKDTDQREAQRVRSSIEKTFLRDVIAYIEVTWSGRDSVITFQLDFDAMANLQLGIGPNEICRSILANKKFKLTSSDMTLEGNLVHIDVRETDMSAKKGKGKGIELIDHYERVSIISRAIPNTVIRGYPDANRVVITESKSNTFSVAVEGYGLKACMNTDGVRGTAVQSNSVMEMRDVLGIEAARATIIIEIAKVMDNLNIDPRHMQLLADVMTFKGDVLGITRFGLSKMRDSVLQLASFEKTPDHLFEAAWHMKSDKIEGVSECIIMGQPMSIGTGAFNVVMANERREGDVQRRKTVFEDCWRDVMGKK